MITRLTILNASGDLKVEWDSADPEACRKAREEVAELKKLGYQFYLVDGNPADEIAAGNGLLIVKKLTADEVIGEEATEEAGSAQVNDESVSGPSAEPDQPRKKRGRPAKNAKAGPDQQVVAVRPVRGG